jgi:hypothetical protein
LFTNLRERGYLLYLDVIVYGVVGGDGMRYLMTIVGIELFEEIEGIAIFMKMIEVIDGEYSIGLLYREMEGRVELLFRLEWGFRLEE